MYMVWYIKPDATKYLLYDMKTSYNKCPYMKKPFLQQTYCSFNLKDIKIIAPNGEI
jgi:hypothetical protein